MADTNCNVGCCYEALKTDVWLVNISPVISLPYFYGLVVGIDLVT